VLLGCRKSRTIHAGAGNAGCYLEEFMKNMPKSLRTFIDDCIREIPNEVIHITKEVDPAHYDVTAIIKHLGAQKKFPIIIFDKPLNLNKRVGDIKLAMNCE